jgi:hypothetical protein
MSFKKFLSNNTVFAEKYKAEETAATKKGFQNLRLNFLKPWSKYKKWLGTRQGESLLLLPFYSSSPFNTAHLLTLLSAGFLSRFRTRAGLPEPTGVDDIPAE